jgi:hypothetical protein
VMSGRTAAGQGGGRSETSGRTAVGVADGV